jgi:demethylmenaquinone methyltransferase / 2-methoxy-6-polyprenyl-1,4-benzoquinol methylase
VDVSDNMLALARQKVSRKGLEEKIALRWAEAEHLPFEEASFDAAMVAFGARNFGDLPAGLREMHRVLKPGGHIMVLEFSRPAATPFRQVYLWYFRRILPAVGKAISRSEHAYRYLPETVMRFPEGEDFLRTLTASGFAAAEQKRLTGGIATIYLGSKHSGTNPRPAETARSTPHE